MKNVNLSDFESLEVDLKENLEMVKKAYKCEWDDEVHDSYGIFINSLKNELEEMVEIKKNLRKIEKEVDNLNVDGIIKDSDGLILEA